MKLASLVAILALAQSEPRFDVFERSIPELQDAMTRGETTSVGLVRQYLARIEAFDRGGPALRSMIFVSPDAIEHARQLDRERANGRLRGALHGIPIVLKDNYDTFDMPTTAGSVALAGYVPADDGFQVAKLREAGAVFIGKTNMHELARGITTISSLGGQTKNPYGPERNPGGSSGGTGAAVAASFAAVGMGSDTCGSIRIPAANNNLFGLRVTQGLSSRDGIIPLSHTQDVGGPIARSVIDLVIVLDATVGPDPSDPQTQGSEERIPESYRAFLREDGLRGMRLGLLKPYLEEDGPEEEVTTLVLDAAAAMERAGAELVEIQFPDFDSLLDGSGVIGLEFKFDLRDYLSAAHDPPVRNLREILDRGLFHVALGAGFERSDAVEEESQDYQDALAKRDRWRQALTELLARERLDALVYPTLRIKPARIGERQRGTSCALSANSGFPSMSLPAGFTPDGIPVGIELLAGRFEEPKLLSMAYAYEQTATPRRPPPRAPSLVGNVLSVDFELQGPSMSGKLRLDRPTQTLSYELDFRGRSEAEVVDILLHRDDTGAVVALAGPKPTGSIAIRNEDLALLLSGSMSLSLHTTSEPTGAASSVIRRLP